MFTRYTRSDPWMNSVKWIQCLPHPPPKKKTLKKKQNKQKHQTNKQQQQTNNTKKYWLPSHLIKIVFDRLFPDRIIICKNDYKTFFGDAILINHYHRNLVWFVTWQDYLWGHSVGMKAMSHSILYIFIVQFIGPGRLRKNRKLNSNWHFH